MFKLGPLLFILPWPVLAGMLLYYLYKKATAPVAKKHKEGQIRNKKGRKKNWNTWTRPRTVRHPGSIASIAVKQCVNYKYNISLFSDQLRAFSSQIELMKALRNLPQVRHTIHAQNCSSFWSSNFYFVCHSFTLSALYTLLLIVLIRVSLKYNPFQLVSIIGWCLCSHLSYDMIALIVFRSHASRKILYQCKHTHLRAQRRLNHKTLYRTHLPSSSSTVTGFIVSPGPILAVFSGQKYKVFFLINCVRCFELQRRSNHQKSWWSNFNEKLQK